MTRLDKFMPQGVPRWIRCYDNGGKTVDRYTVVFTGRYRHKTQGETWVLVMDHTPFAPQGFGQHCPMREIPDVIGGKWPPAIGRKNHLGTRIPFSALPEDCQRAVIDDYVDLWDLREGVKA